LMNLSINGPNLEHIDWQQIFRSWVNKTKGMPFVLGPYLLT
jgi:hypothetical protein